MANDAYKKVSSCHEWVYDKEDGKRRRRLHLLLERGPF